MADATVHPTLLGISCEARRRRPQLNVPLRAPHLLDALVVRLACVHLQGGSEQSTARG